MSGVAEVFPPGEFLKEELDARNWSQTEFAEIIGRPVRLINELIAGKKSITPETAVQLGASLGTTAELWMNLESQYQLSKVRTHDQSIKRKAVLHAKFPVREMIKRGWVAASDDIEVLEQQFLDFYGISSLEEQPSLAHAAKKTSYDKAVSVLQWAWLYRVKAIAESFVVKPYDPEALIASLSTLRQLLSAPEEIRHVPRILNEAGVRLVIVETLPGSKIDGACLWLSETRPVVALSARLDRIDNFWFVLRHEIEHLVREHGKDSRLMLDVELAESIGNSLQMEEREANEAASQFGVTDEELRSYMMRVNPYFFAKERVLGFAGRLGVHPGLVVGRLHKELEHSGSGSPYRFLREYLVKVRHFISPSAPTDGWGNIFSIT
jgi:HTH-type transcriptional regulator / antitoxin HigA